MNERAASSQHGGGFSVDAGVRIEATDRAGLERLLRYCARPPFAMDRHRHRYYGVLAPNSPLRGAVTAMAQVALPVPSAQVVQTSPKVVQPSTGASSEPPPKPKPKPRPPSHYLWAALIARIYEVFPLICAHCGGQMRIIAFITFSADIQKILEHIGVEPEAPRITPARGPPLWDDAGAQESQELGEGVDAEPDWAMANQSPPDYSHDQRTTW